MRTPLLLALILCFSSAPAGGQETPAPSKLPPWYGPGIARALLDPAANVAREALSLPDAARALAESKFDDQRMENSIISMLLSHLEDVTNDPTDVVAGPAAEALGLLLISDPKLRDGVGEALLRRFTSVMSKEFSYAIRPLILALGRYKPNNAKLGDDVVSVLLKRFFDPKDDLSRTWHSSTVDALRHIAMDDPRRREIIIKDLIQHLTNTPKESDRSGLSRGWAAIALGSITSNDANQRAAIVNALVRALDDSAGDENGNVGVAAVRALGRLHSDDAAQRAGIAAQLLRRADDLASARAALIRPSALGSLAEIVEPAAKIRDAIVANFLKRLDDVASDPQGFNRAAAAAGLAKVKPDDLKLRDNVTAALLRRFSDPGPDPKGAVQKNAVMALAQLSLDDPKSRPGLVSILLKRLGDKAPDPNEIHVAVIDALSKIPTDPTQRATVIATLISRLNEAGSSPDVDGNAGVAAASALAAIASIDVAQSEQIIRALIARLENPKDDQFGTIRHASAYALGSITSLSLEQQRTVVGTLLRWFENPATYEGGYIREGAATALSRIKIEDPLQRATITNAMLSRVRTWQHNGTELDTFPVIQTLGRVEVSEPNQRRRVKSTLISELKFESSRPAAEIALLSFDKLETDEILMLFKYMYEDAPARSGFWRAVALAYSGPTKATEPPWLLLSFLGRPAESSLPWEKVKNPQAALELLKQLDASWASIAESGGLREEAARRANEVIEHSCPSTASSSGRPWINVAWELVSSELQATWSHVAGLVWLDAPRRCWSGRELVTLNGLHEHIAKSSELRAYATQLNNHLKAEQAAPVLGLVLLSYVAWALPSIALIGAFPRSERVRSLYLYSGKVRVFASLGWIPILLLLSPFARKRMLDPFRQTLLADAELDDFDETHWFPDSIVIDRTGKISPLRHAVPDVVGATLLVGESGLGKSTYLRLLAKRAPRALAFLKARACDKGVVEAIVAKAKEVQDTSFFKSLLETRNLAVIIDGLNEASADTRALIIRFVSDFSSANILMTTQPIESIDLTHSPFGKVVAYELQPLDRTGIERFLTSRPSREGGRVTGEKYDEAAKSLLTEQLDNARTREEREAAQLIFSNPMDLTYAGELLALGQTPRPDEMIGQAFKLASDRYERHRQSMFPILDFARKAVELRNEGRNWLYQDEFAAEQEALREYRLMVPRTVYGRDGKEAVGLVFRHQKVWDFFMHLAFTEDKALQLGHIDDPRFRGVYLLFAQTADVETAQRLREIIIVHAADTKDHTLSDEFVRRLAIRTRPPGRRPKRDTKKLPKDPPEGEAEPC
jgi:GNAT superfamily N-acetyltransferase